MKYRVRHESIYKDLENNCKYLVNDSKKLKKNLWKVGADPGTRAHRKSKYEEMEKNRRKMKNWKKGWNNQWGNIHKDSISRGQNSEREFKVRVTSHNWED